MSVRPLRILIVDDNVDAAEMFGELMILNGFETRIVHDGGRGVAVARAFFPDVIFLDLGLPGMDGFEVARTLRADPSMSACTMVAVTGWGSAEDKRKTQEAGFHLHLTKPVKKAGIDQVFALVKAKGSDSVKVVPAPL
jgi:CheY-like chemotaxis protein